MIHVQFPPGGTLISSLFDAVLKKYKYWSAVDDSGVCRVYILVEVHREIFVIFVFCYSGKRKRNCMGQCIYITQDVLLLLLLATSQIAKITCHTFVAL